MGAEPWPGMFEVLGSMPSMSPKKYRKVELLACVVEDGWMKTPFLEISSACHQICPSISGVPWAMLEGIPVLPLGVKARPTYVLMLSGPVAVCPSSSNDRWSPSPPLSFPFRSAVMLL